MEHLELVTLIVGISCQPERGCRHHMRRTLRQHAPAIPAVSDAPNQSREQGGRGTRTVAAAHGQGGRWEGCAMSRERRVGRALLNNTENRCCAGESRASPDPASQASRSGGGAAAGRKWRLLGTWSRTLHERAGGTAVCLQALAARARAGPAPARLALGGARPHCASRNTRRSERSLLLRRRRRRPSAKRTNYA